MNRSQKKIFFNSKISRSSAVSGSHVHQHEHRIGKWTEIQATVGCILHQFLKCFCKLRPFSQMRKLLKDYQNRSMAVFANSHGGYLLCWVGLAGTYTPWGWRLELARCNARGGKWSQKICMRIIQNRVSGNHKRLRSVHGKPQCNSPVHRLCLWRRLRPISPGYPSCACCRWNGATRPQRHGGKTKMTACPFNLLTSLSEEWNNCLEFR